MLDQCIDRNTKESREKSEQSKYCCHLNESNPAAAEYCSKERHAGRAQWDEAIFDFVSGKISGCQASDPNPDGDGCLQVSIALRLEVQDVAAIKNNVGLEQHSEEPEVR